MKRPIGAANRNGEPKRRTETTNRNSEPKQRTETANRNSEPKQRTETARKANRNSDTHIAVSVRRFRSPFRFVFPRSPFRFAVRFAVRLLRFAVRFAVPVRRAHCSVCRPSSPALLSMTTEIAFRSARCRRVLASRRRRRRTRRALRALRPTRFSGARLHRQSDPISLQVHRDHSHANLLSNPHHRVRIADIPVGELRDVHEAVLMNADVDESSEGDDVRHDALELHPFGEMLWLSDVGPECRCLERFTWIAPRLPKLCENIVKRR